MTSDRKKPGVAFWATVVVVVGLAAYPLSFGPACWWFSSSVSQKPAANGDLLQQEVELRGTSGRWAPRFYWPIGWLAAKGPRPISTVIRGYATLFVGSIDLPYSSDGGYFMVVR